jgi:tRNA(fMet)-specific endonuclease VapC
VGVILDTNAVSALFEGNAALARVLGVAIRHELPSIVVGEYRYGLARSRHRRTLLPLLEELVRESVVLDVGLATAQAYATIRERLRRKGRPIPENDVWISALAVEHGLEVVSRDVHFDEVEGLRRRGW